MLVFMPYLPILKLKFGAIKLKGHGEEETTIFLKILAALGFCCGMGALFEGTGSVVAVLKLSCPAACGILPPWPWIEPASPAMEGGFLSTGPPGKSPGNFLNESWQVIF